MSEELMFRAVADLAALVDAGEISATELVGASLARIEALDPELNAFAEVDADGPGPPPRRSRPAIRARSPGCRSRSRTTARSPGCG